MVKGSQPGQDLESPAETENTERFSNSPPEHALGAEGGWEK